MSLGDKKRSVLWLRNLTIKHTHTHTHKLASCCWWWRVSFYMIPAPIQQNVVQEVTASLQKQACASQHMSLASQEAIPGFILPKKGARRHIHKWLKPWEAGQQMESQTHTLNCCYHQQVVEAVKQAQGVNLERKKQKALGYHDHYLCHFHPHHSHHALANLMYLLEIYFIHLFSS